MLPQIYFWTIKKNCFLTLKFILKNPCQICMTQIIIYTSTASFSSFSRVTNTTSSSSFMLLAGVLGFPISSVFCCPNTLNCNTQDNTISKVSDIYIFILYNITTHYTFILTRVRMENYSNNSCS